MRIISFPMTERFNRERRPRLSPPGRCRKEMLSGSWSGVYPRSKKHVGPALLLGNSRAQRICRKPFFDHVAPVSWDSFFMGANTAPWPVGMNPPETSAVLPFAWPHRD